MRAIALALALSTGLLVAETARAADIRGRVGLVTAFPESFSHGKVRVISSTGVLSEVHLLSQPSAGLRPLTPTQAELILTAASAYPDFIFLGNVAPNGSAFTMHADSRLAADWVRSGTAPLQFSGSTTARVDGISVPGDAGRAGMFATVIGRRDDGRLVLIELRSVRVFENGRWFEAMTAAHAQRMLDVAAGSRFVSYDGERLSLAGDLIIRLYRESWLDGVRP